MLKAVENTSRWTTDKILVVRALMAETIEYVRKQLPKIHTHELIQALLHCRIVGSITSLNEA